MADEVKIKAPGSDLDNAVLQNAATEATLKKLVDALGGKGSNTASKIKDAANKSAKGLDELRKSSKNTQNQFEKLQNRSKILSEGIKDFGYSLMVTGKKFGDLLQPIASVMAKLNPSMSLFYGGILALVNEVDRQVDVFRELSTVGADFGDGIFGSRMAAIAAGLSLDVFTEQVKANANTFGLLGGSVNRGVKTFTNISRNIQFDFQPTLSRLGFTMKDTTDYITDYLEIQTQLGKAQGMSQEDLTEGSKEYLLQLDLLSRVTGQSRKQLSEELKRQAQDLKLKSLMATMDKDAQANLQQIIAGLGSADSRLKAAIEEMIVTGGAPVSDFAIMLTNAAPELRELAAGVRNGTVSSAEFAAGMRRASAAANENRGQFQQLAVAAQITGREALVAGSTLLDLSNYQSKAAEVTKEQLEAQQASAKALTDFDNQMRKFRNTFIVLISPMLEALGFGLSLLTKGISLVTGFFSVLGNIIDKVTGMFGEFPPILKDLSYGLKVLLGTLMLYGMYRGSAALVRGGMNMGSKILGMGPSVTDASTKKPKSTPSAGKTAGTLASGAGLVASAKGIGILALAVAAIGAVLAGATWLMGGALEKLGTGLGKVAEVDGDRLKSVGEGVKELAGAMIIFGTGGGFGEIKNINLESFAKNINATLDSLDKDKIDSYTEALNNLGESFAKVQSSMSGAVSSSGKTSAEKLDELNMTMKEVLYVLESSKRYQRDTATAVQDNG